MRRGFHIFRGSRHVVRDHLNAKKRWQRVRGLPRIFPGRNVAAEFQFAMQKVRRLVPLSSRWISDAWWMPTCTAANYYALVGGGRFSRDLSRFPIERLSARFRSAKGAFVRFSTLYNPSTSCRVPSRISTRRHCDKTPCTFVSERNDERRQIDLLSIHTYIDIVDHIIARILIGKLIRRLCNEF